jgi:hypothetical protein
LSPLSSLLTARALSIPRIFRVSIESIQYVKTDYADGVDFTITAEATTETIWTESNVNAAVIKHPRAATHSTAWRCGSVRERRHCR